MAFDKENHYGKYIKNAYYKEFDLLHDKICNMYEMMKESDISRLFFKIKKSKEKIVTVRIFRYKRSTDVIVNTIEIRQDKIYDYADTYKFYSDKVLLREETRLYKHDLESESELISRWMD
ncbi:MAG: hypothetical protein E7C47_09605 [Veillonella sp.]|uniref:hypothetical protein n=1 Tax=Veillonella sp. TaxID=1926307 RepID=UPI0028FE2535|nr:hypothetical protein [Veillonella sp.]MDU2702382.1 hypothetical protein [Veillonella sp.]